jgi:hypothetical protein
MTIRELKELIAGFDDNFDVWIDVVNEVGDCYLVGEIELDEEEGCVYVKGVEE